MIQPTFPYLRTVLTGSILLLFCIVATLSCRNRTLVKSGNVDSRKTWLVSELMAMANQPGNIDNAFTIKGYYAGVNKTGFPLLSSVTGTDNSIKSDSIACVFPPANADQFRAIQVGSEITITGIPEQTGETLQLKDCRIISINEGVIFATDYQPE
jgi:hypothetical protein